MGTNWLVNGNPAAAGQYPGFVFGDSADFSSPMSRSATLDVALNNDLLELGITNWSDTLTLNNDLSAGGFHLEDPSTVTLAAGKTLSTVGGSWLDGTITGGANSAIKVIGGDLTTSLGGGAGSPAGLGTNMIIQKSAAGLPGSFTLTSMTNNLLLNGTNNTIDVGDEGSLILSQEILTPGQQNTVGGIDLAAAHTGTLAVQVEVGGRLQRGDPLGSQLGVPDQVSIAGAVYNVGGTVEVGGDAGSMLNITGKDANNYSYWQKTSDNALLLLDVGGNLNAAGTYQIDKGTVQLTAPNGGGADELDGLGLNFANTNSTFLTIVDSGMIPGSITVQGPVTLAANTTTTLNYVGNRNQSDLLDVKNGTLTLAGNLTLISNGSGKPTIPLNFFDDSGVGPVMLGAFLSIDGDVGSATYTPRKVVNNPQLIYYEVTIT